MLISMGNKERPLLLSDREKRGVTFLCLSPSGRGWIAQSARRVRVWVLLKPL